MERYDVIIVGAGSAGCVLAARLSENPSRKILLLEAGPHFTSVDSFPKELKYGGILSSMAPDHPNNWAFAANLRNGVDQIVPRGKVVGGSSALNGTLFTRALPEDFDGWANAGNHEWSFDKVLPYLRKLETDLDFRDDFHGSNGPIPVRRATRTEWSPVAHAFFNSCLDAGFPEDPDVNGPKSIGVGALAVNNVNGIRMNTAITYLQPALGRSNLTVRGDIFVQRILFKGQKAAGIEGLCGGQKLEAEGAEVVLSAGAVKSPHLLMLSGVGPADQLRNFNIPAIHDSPNVGQNFSDHASLSVRLQVKKDVRVDPLKSSWAQTALHYTANGSDVYSDMMLLPSSIPLNTAVLYDVPLLKRAKLLLDTLRSMSLPKVIDQVLHGGDHSISLIMMQARARGKMTLTSADPADKPRLNFNYLEDDVDLERARDGMRLAARLLETRPYREIGAKRFSPTDEELASDSALNEFLSTHVGTSIHMSGTCRMGPASDQAAVVDQYCRVYGIEGVRVVDTSIMPQVVRRCPANTAVMIGERAAAFFD
ncbi:MAG TPA: GMC family oxidoreductase N-terminal domain-containing protein [Candidatus Binataceae bacterium]|nr:GMC family oxidoreductase N-terminal domain-containing protein [Candidatus Binataceae bacterium]